MTLTKKMHMAIKPTPTDLLPVLILASRAQVEAITTRLRARGFDDVTPAFAIIMPLLDDTGVRATALAQRAGVTKQAMSQLIKVLEERGYVVQTADPSDTRAKVVRLTKRGLALDMACSDVRNELQAQAVALLGKKDVVRLEQSLSKLTAMLNFSRDR